ncbi:hypothetical protein [Streptomyces sp. TE33382]
MLVLNAVVHGEPDARGEFGLGFGLAEAGELLIDVQDSLPDARSIDTIVAGHGGLWTAQSLGAEITWHLGSGGKTVRALLPTPEKTS